MLDKAAEPLGFLDPELRTGFLAAFRAMGGEYCGGSEVSGARFDMQPRHVLFFSCHLGSKHPFCRLDID